MFIPPESRWSIPFDGSFEVRAHPTAPLADPPAKKELRRQLNEVIKDIDDLQYRLFAEDSRSLLLIFQALDAAGKDSTIRAVFRGVNPAGLQVTAFGEPSDLDLDHDFLWRTTRMLPQRGRLGVFNRSYYEEVLVVRVHPLGRAPRFHPRPRSAPCPQRHHRPQVLAQRLPRHAGQAPARPRRRP